jgi:hypothetical protein
MSRLKTYKHLIQTDAFGIRTKIKNFVKPRVTKARKDTKVRG